jgi:hypothetical protein
MSAYAGKVDLAAAAPDFGDWASSYILGEYDSRRRAVFKKLHARAFWGDYRQYVPAHIHIPLSAVTERRRREGLATDM